MTTTPEPAASLRLDDFLPYRLSVTSNVVSERVAGTYQALFALSIPEWRTIAVTAELERTTQAAIGIRTRMDKVTVSRAVTALVQRGLLVREANEADRRSHWLSLSGEGQALYEAVAPKALELERRIFSAIPKAELEAFAAMLRRIEGLVLEG